jgi:K+ transporter
VRQSPDQQRGSRAIGKRVHTASGHATDRHERGHTGSIGFLALTALGVVFGDIGTGPLYAISVALNATGHSMPTQANVMCVVSLIFWALIVLVALKYVQLVLRADIDGEGSILALPSLVGATGGWPDCAFPCRSSWASSAPRCCVVTA